MKWNIDHLPVFLAVQEMKGVTGAAKRLQMPKSTVSRILSKLEESLDIRLFDRNTRQFRLTAEGEIFFHHAQVIMDHVYATNEALAGLRHAPSGVLKVAMPMALSRDIVGPRLNHFRKRFPEVILQMTVTPYPVNLLREDLDLAFVVGEQDASDMVIRKILDTSLIWVASSDYAGQHKFGDKIADLIPHLSFCERRYQTGRLAVKSTQGRQFLDTSALMSVNDPVILRDILLDGGGIALLPALYCYEYLDSGKLLQVFPTIEPEDKASIYALLPSRRLQPYRARVFLDFVDEIISEHIDRSVKILSRKPQNFTR